MGVEDDCVSGGDNVYDVSAESRNGMRRGRDRGDDAEGGILLEHDSVVAAAPVRVQPFYARDELDDLKLLDLMIQPPNLRFFQFNAAPFGRIRIGHRFDDFDNLHPSSYSLLFQL